jgi:trans-aconitate methyltransferase
MLTPKSVNEYLVELTFQKLNRQNSFHSAPIEVKEEKYGTASKFFTINKNEEPTFLLAYKKALEAVKVEDRKHILNLGINKGDEFELIEQLIGEEKFDNINFTGVDHSQTALTYAKERFPKDNVNFYQHDIAKLSKLHLKKSDLIISIGTLQSPSINYKPFLMSLVQEHLTHDGAFILGFPNSRWIDTELIYGAKAPNYPYSEMSLLFNDVIFAKKYLQQKKFRVTITGREYIFLTATRIGL